jgi:hypothetical protein
MRGDWQVDVVTSTATPTAGQVSFGSAGEMEEVLDRVLSQVDADEKAGPLLRATGMRLRLRCPDIDFAVNIAASEDPGRCIEWTFAKQSPWEPKLELTMSSSVANAYLQGAASVPVAIARGQIKCAGDARSALLYLPAAKLITDPYRELVADSYPHLAVGEAARDSR